MQPQEVEANRFAAELLMPSEYFRLDMSGASLDFTLISSLANKYMVSKHAASNRLLDFIREPYIVFTSTGTIIDTQKASKSAKSMYHPLKYIPKDTIADKVINGRGMQKHFIECDSEKWNIGFRVGMKLYSWTRGANNHYMTILRWELVRDCSIILLRGGLKLILLWTIQNHSAYGEFLKTGVLTANESHLFCEDNFLIAYDWMVKKMKDKRLHPPVGIDYPIWAWYQWEGKRKRRDMRESGYAKRGEKMVQLTIEVDDKDVLLSDFDLFHYVLNYWYLPSDEQDDICFEEEYKARGYLWHDLKDSSIQSKEMIILREKIVRSWDKIFELNREDDDWLYGSNNKKSIQAAFWQLRLEQVIKAKVFTAK